MADGVLVFGRVQRMVQMIAWGIKVSGGAKARPQFLLSLLLCSSHSYLQRTEGRGLLPVPATLALLFPELVTELVLMTCKTHSIH